MRTNNISQSESVAILVPIYNEAPGLPIFLEQLKSAGYPILIVDDGSTDDSFEITQRSGIETIRLPRNLGKGRALKIGFSYLLKKSYSWIVMMDGDGQHLPQDIPRFIQTAQSGQYDLVNGNRLCSSRGMPWMRFVVNHSMSKILSWIAKKPIEDSQCGFKMLSGSFLRSCAFTSCHFEIESEIMLKAAKRQLRIGTVPIRSIYRNEGSHVHPLRDTIRFFRFLYHFFREDVNFTL